RRRRGGAEKAGHGGRGPGVPRPPQAARVHALALRDAAARAAGGPVRVHGRPLPRGRAAGALRRPRRGVREQRRGGREGLAQQHLHRAHEHGHGRAAEGASRRVGAHSAA
ncbi:unnamed protein product, partial [Prorocentrum cordatum]